jgi:hypothetical protein
MRVVTKHPPYLHDGSVTTLREVVELESEGHQDTAPTAFPQQALLPTAWKQQATPRVAWPGVL